MSKEGKNVEAVNSKTGEVKPLPLKQIAAALDEASDWKPDDSDKVAADFLKGDFWETNKELRGVYLGCEVNGKRLQHKFATKGKDGKVKELMCNGTYDLNRQLSAVEPGAPVFIKYLSTEKLDGGRSTKKFAVYTPRG